MFITLTVNGTVAMAMPETPTYIVYVPTIRGVATVVISLEVASMENWS